MPTLRESAYLPIQNKVTEFFNSPPPDWLIPTFSALSHLSVVSPIILGFRNFVISTQLAMLGLCSQSISPEAIMWWKGWHYQCFVTYDTINIQYLLEQLCMYAEYLYVRGECLNIIRALCLTDLHSKNKHS